MVSKVQLMHRMEFLKQFPDKFFDWVVDDPPYFSGPEKRKFYGYKNSSIGVKRVDYDVTTEWQVPGKEYFDLLIQKSKNQIIWGVNYYDYQFPSPGRIVWDKVNADSTFSDCEIAFCSAHDTVRLFRYMWNGMNQGKSISEGHIMQGNKKLNEKRIHTTQKPVNLYKWIYLKYIKEGDVVGDCHLGSGSHRIAAYEYGIDFYASELTKENYQNQEIRFKQHINQQQLFRPDIQLTIQ